MILRLALRSLGSRPVRTAVLAMGFGLGVAVMAALLGIAGVILEQARAPELEGGGDVVIDGASGRVPQPRLLLSAVLAKPPLGARVAAAAPAERGTLYLVDASGATTPIRARGGIPSLERALHDPETGGTAAWVDTPADRAWMNPDPDQLLRSMDRFHPIPDVPARRQSWAEWLYFNGRTNGAAFYLTFLAGPETSAGTRTVGVRLQLDRGGSMAMYSTSADIDADELLADAPDLTIGNNRVRLTGSAYHVSIDLPAESGSARASGTLVLQAEPQRALPPLSIRGANGWVSGYVVPVMGGDLHGTIDVGGQPVSFDGATGYHDHNWGFWKDVSWQWGQVHGDGLSIVYGRVHPPADAADASRIPAFLMALGPDGPLGYATNVTIDETDRAASESPERIVVRGRSPSLQLSLELRVNQITTTQSRPGSFGGGLDFLQLRGGYHVSGTVGSATIGFDAPGSAETFRGR